MVRCLDLTIGSIAGEGALQNLLYPSPCGKGRIEVPILRAAEGLQPGTVKCKHFPSVLV